MIYAIPYVKKDSFTGLIDTQITMLRANNTENKGFLQTFANGLSMKDSAQKGVCFKQELCHIPSPKTNNLLGRSTV